MKKVYINKETKEVVGICDEEMDITDENEFIDLSEEEITKIMSKSPETRYIIKNGIAERVIDNNYYLEQINILKNNLLRTDYQAIKHGEGLITDEEYEPIKAQRQAWRDEINELEQEIEYIDNI